MTMKEKLKSISSDEKSEWVARTKEKLAHAGARKNARAVALRVLDILEAKGMTQTELADKMGVSRQQVTKIVKGKENFTFETIDKLEKALKTRLMTIAGGEEVPQLREKQVSQKDHLAFQGTEQIFHLPAGMVAAAFGNRAPLIIGAEQPGKYSGIRLPSSWSASGSGHSITLILRSINDLTGRHVPTTHPSIPMVGFKKESVAITGIIKPSDTSGVAFNMS